MTQRHQGRPGWAGSSGAPGRLVAPPAGRASAVAWMARSPRPWRSRRSASFSRERAGDREGDASGLSREHRQGFRARPDPARGPPRRCRRRRIPSRGLRSGGRGPARRRHGPRAVRQGGEAGRADELPPRARPAREAVWSARHRPLREPAGRGRVIGERLLEASSSVMSSRVASTAGIAAAIARADLVRGTAPSWRSDRRPRPRA